MASQSENERFDSPVLTEDFISFVSRSNRTTLMAFAIFAVLIACSVPEHHSFVLEYTTRRGTGPI